MSSRSVGNRSGRSKHDFPICFSQEFKEKSLKLLADPCKLKDIQYNPKYRDSFKKEKESLAEMGELVAGRGAARLGGRWSGGPAG